MVPLTPVRGFLINMKLTEYIKETRAEMVHVSWPSRKQAISYAVAVIAVSIGTALILALFDFIFGKLLTLVV
jgi:preprotein translocase subunit SecE